MSHIAHETGVHIRISEKVEDVGVQPDQRVTAKSRGASLESFLNRMLEDLGLTLLVKDEAIVITTLEDSQSPEKLQTRVYPVADLVRTPDGQNNFDPLIDIITSTVEPDTWQDVGGPGAVNGFDNSISLVITQRRQIHQRIEAMLTTLRRAKKFQNISSPYVATNGSSANQPLSRSIKYERRSSKPAGWTQSDTTPPPQPQMSGGFFSVANPIARAASQTPQRATVGRLPLPQVYEAAE